jgi:isopenicillin-N epimerase
LGPILAAVSSRTRLALIDHVTSPTGLVFPIDELVARLGQRGVDVLVDGAHAPGMIRVNLNRTGAPYYTGNCHKWLCAPKGAGFLHVRRDRQKGLRPLTISHGANSPRQDRSRFQLEFGWTGTVDPSPYLCVPEAIQFIGRLLPGGWPAVIRHNRLLALEGRRILCAALDIDEPCPASMIGSLASVPLPKRESAPKYDFARPDPLQQVLWNKYRIEVPIVPWPSPPRRLLRISAQLYNHRHHFKRLGQALLDELGGCPANVIGRNRKERR